MPKAVFVRERTAERKTRTAVMAEAEPAAVPIRVPPDRQVVDLRIDRGRRLAGADHAGTRRPAGARRDPGPRQGARGHLRRVFVTWKTPRQHLVFLPDTEVELTLVGTEPLADIQLKIQSGNPARIEAGRRTDIHHSLGPPRGDDAGDPAEVRRRPAWIPGPCSSRSDC